MTARERQRDEGGAIQRRRGHRREDCHIHGHPGERKAREIPGSMAALRNLPSLYIPSIHPLAVARKNTFNREFNKEFNQEKEGKP
jgi:hypothetical protein